MDPYYYTAYQINDGFILQNRENLYWADNNFNLLEEYNFSSAEITHTGYALSRERSQFLNVKTGEITDFDFDFRYQINSDKTAITRFEDRSQQNYDFETNSWYDVLVATYGIKGNAKMLRFNYKKSYITDMPVKFNRYIYKNGKSILIFNNKMKVYEGELFSKERLFDFLHGKSRAYINDNYAHAIDKFSGNFYDYNQPFPDHLMFEEYILDVNNVDLYRYTSQNYIMGIIDDSVVDAKGRLIPYKLPENQVPNDYFRYDE